MITIYSKKGKKCGCDIAQLPQMLEKGFTENKPKQMEEAQIVSTPKAKNPNRKAK